MADQLDSDVLLTEKLAVFLAEAVHAFAGGLHFLWTANAIRKIVQSLRDLCDKIRWDASGCVGCVHRFAPPAQSNDSQVRAKLKVVLRSAIRVRRAPARFLIIQPALTFAAADDTPIAKVAVRLGDDGT